MTEKSPREKLAVGLSLTKGVNDVFSYDSAFIFSFIIVKENFFPMLAIACDTAVVASSKVVLAEHLKIIWQASD